MKLNSIALFWAGDLRVRWFCSVGAKHKSSPGHAASHGIIHDAGMIRVLILDGQSAELITTGD